MAKLIIPSSVIDGFKEIAKLNENQITELAEYLQQMDVGAKFDAIDKFISSKITSIDSASIVRTIISFGDLLDGDDVKFDELAHELRESVEDIFSEESDLNFDRLEANLLEIFENSKNLKLTTKVFNLLVQNNNIYIEGKIISDIRLVFNDNLTETNRNGVIIHRLNITVQNKKENSDIVISLDNSDLKKLKDVIERALLKEEIIKEDYENIHFITY